MSTSSQEKQEKYDRNGQEDVKVDDVRALPREPPRAPLMFRFRRRALPSRSSWKTRRDTTSSASGPGVSFGDLD